MVNGHERRAHSADSDLALVHRVLAGSHGALPLLAERLRCVARTAQLLDQKQGYPLGSEGLGDLTQDVLVLTWRKLGEFEGLSTLEGWIYGICLLEHQNAVRRKRRLREEAQVLAAHSRARPAAALDPDPWAFEEVHAALRRIGRGEARIIRLKHFEGHSFEEIARALGLSPNTVKARYYRGLGELRPLLEKEAGRG